MHPTVHPWAELKFPPTHPAVLAYMQLLEDYSEPQPSVFYQTPQSEHVYQQKNRMLMEVYGITDSFSGADGPQELAPPPALPPKQRQLVSALLPVPSTYLPCPPSQVFLPATSQVPAVSACSSCLFSPLGSP